MEATWNKRPNGPNIDPEFANDVAKRGLENEAKQRRESKNVLIDTDDYGVRFAPSGGTGVLWFSIWIARWSRNALHLACAAENDQKMEPGARKGRLCWGPGTIWVRFDHFLGIGKLSIKNLQTSPKMRPRAATRPQCRRLRAHLGVEGPRGGDHLSKK